MKRTKHNNPKLSGAFCLLFAMVTILVFFGCSGTSEQLLSPQKGDFVLLYENDVHCSYQGYPVVAQLKHDLEKKGCRVAVVSAGDFAAGGLWGNISDGQYLVKIMNQVGYDAVAIGNHEFDWGLKALNSMMDSAKFPFLCSNIKFTDTAGNHCPTFNQCKGMEVKKYVLGSSNTIKVAFIGVTTPECLTRTHPFTFYSDSMRDLLRIKNGDTAGLAPMFYFSTGTAMANDVQKLVDSARTRCGADLVVLLCHLGKSDSEKLAASVTDVDLVVDGHDHRTAYVFVEGMNKDKKMVPVVSTGNELNNLGVAVFRKTGANGKSPVLVSNQILSLKQDWDSIDSFGVHETIVTIESKEDDYGVVRDTHVFTVKDGDGNWTERRGESCLGDLVADALRKGMWDLIPQNLRDSFSQDGFDSIDIGWVNSGGVRGDVKPKCDSITHNTLLNAFPFKNDHLCVISATGESILKALDLAVSEFYKKGGGGGGFPQVSGLSFTIDADTSGGKKVRVRRDSVKVGGKKIDSAKSYAIAGTDFPLILGGDRVVFENKKVLFWSDSCTLEPFLEKYLKEKFRDGIDEQYQNPKGRIVVEGLSYSAGSVD